MVLSTLDLTLLILYALICIGIGIWSAKRQKEDEYLIAGRKLSVWSFMATMVATYIGGGALVAYTAYVYEFGISAIALFVGSGIGYLVFVWYALVIRRVGKEKEFHTLSDWYRDKFDNKNAIISAIIVFVVYLGALVVQFIAGSSVLSVISGWSYGAALLFSGTVILIYLALGGFRSVVRTDVFQYLVLIILFVVIGFVMVRDGGVSKELLDFSKLGISLTITFIIYGIIYIFVASEYWQRIYAAKNSEVIRKGLIGSAILIVITGFALTLIGLAAGTSFPGIDPSEAAAYGFINLLPAGLISLSLILLFAAIMSSADSIIFVLASSVSKDYFGHKFYNQLNERKLVKLTRTFIVFFSIIGMVFAFFFRDIIAVVLTISGLLFALAPSVIGSFHSKLSNNAVFASMLAGIIYVFILILFDLVIPEYAVASIFVALVVLLVGELIARLTRLTKPI